MNDIEIPKYDFELNDEEIKKIYDIYINSKVNNSDKRYIYSIIPFIRGGNYHTGRCMSNISLFLDFCLNEDVYLSNNFSLMLNRISDEINKIDNKFHTFKEKQMLKRKIILFIVTRNNMINKFVFIDLNQLLNCDLDGLNDKYIIDLFSNNKLALNIEKRNIIFSVILKRRVNINFLNEKLYFSFWNLLTDDNVLLLDNSSYKKIVEFALKDINAYILNETLNIVDNDKKNIVMEYVISMLEKYLYTPEVIDNKTLESSLNLEVFSIIDKLKNCDIDGFKDKLNAVKNSKRPISYSNIFSSSIIDDKRIEFAIKLVNKFNIVEEKLNPNTYNDYYKYTLSLASISPVLNNLPIDYYKNILLIINEYINEVSRNPNNVLLLNNSLKGIIAILDNPNFIDMDYFRLRYTIYIIMMSTNKEMSKEISTFLNNECLNYYSIDEYASALNILKDRFGTSSFIAIKNLLTNNNLPYMNEEDKNRMFAVCYSNDINLIVSLTKELTSLGHINHNNERLRKILIKG